jgi:hypothetical protein
MLEGISEPNRGEEQEVGENYVMRSFLININRVVL